MRVVLTQGLFEAGGASIFELDGLLRAALDREHALVLDPPWSDDESEPVGMWLLSRERAYADAWRKALEDGADKDASGKKLQVRVIEGNLSDWAKLSLAVRDASLFLREPLQLYLENERSDLAFLLRAAGAGRRKALDLAVQRQWAVVRHGGGNTSMKGHVDELLAARRREDEAVAQRAWIETWRLWVLFDRDADESDATCQHGNSRKLGKACERLGVPFHCTSRRSIENYLPIAALDFWSERKTGQERGTRRRRVQTFASDGFGFERRACFAMKDGLKKDQRESDPLPPPFQGLAPEVERALELGFGADIADLFSEPSLHDRAFHEVFERDPVAAQLREAIFTSLFRSL